MPSSATEAVSSIIGTLLLVAITVAVTGVLALSISSVEAPTEDRPAQIAIELEPGKAGWGTGDEVFLVHHKGGKQLPSDLIQLILRSPVMDERVDPSAAPPFDNGLFEVGETWRVTRTVVTGSLYYAVFTYGEEYSVALATTRFNLENAQDCSTDTAGPSAGAWVQSPGNLDTNSLGDLTVEATLSDNCSGVNTTALPNFEYRLQDGSSPPWTTISTTLVSGTRVRAVMPEPASGWAAEAGETVEYRLIAMADELGNTADTAVRTDLITVPLATTFLDCPAVQDTGTVTSCNNWGDDNDGNAEARLDEESSFGSITNIIVATSYVNDGDVDNDERAIGSADDSFARMRNNDARSRVGGFTPGSGAILGVEIFFKGKYEGSYNNDEIRFRYRIGGSLTGDRLDITPTATNTVYSLDVTSDRSWTWSDISNLELDADYRRQGSEDAVDFMADAMWLEITVDVTDYDLAIEGNFTGLPGGSNHELTVRYRSFVDTFAVEVWDATNTAWNNRGTLSQTVATTWGPYLLTSDEYNGGNPRIRFVDLDTASTAGILLVEHAKIESS